MNDSLAEARAALAEWEALSARDANYRSAMYAGRFSWLLADLVRIIDLVPEGVSTGQTSLAGVIMDIHRCGQESVAGDIAKLTVGRHGAAPASVILDEVEERVITILEKGLAGAPHQATRTHLRVVR